MKRISSLILFLFMGFIAFSQDKINLVVFSEDGYPFYAYVNGIKQNESPLSNVKVTGVSPNVSLRIEFEDKSKPQLKQNMALEAGMEHTVRIKEDTKKQLKLRYFGQTALNDPANSGATSVVYHTSETPANTAVSASGSQSKGGTETTVSTTTSKTETSNGDPNNVAINVNMAGMGISMNVNGMENAAGTTINSTTSSTVTTSSSSSGTVKKEAEPAPTAVATAPVTSAQAGSNNCGVPMSAVDFSKMKQSVEAKPFSDTKMSTAKVATKNACLSVNQIKEICKLFSMDEDKLTYAKYAYEHCTDKANFYQVGDVFSFSSTTDELNAFLEK